MSEWPRKYTLTEPIDVAGERITELSFRQPRGKDVRRIPGELKELDPLCDLASRLCGLSKPQFDALVAKDALAIVEMLQDFLGLSPKDGSEQQEQ